MKEEQPIDVRRSHRFWGGAALLLLLLLMIRLFFLNTYFVGSGDAFPEGVRQRCLLLVALQREPKKDGDLVVARFVGKEGKPVLLPARVIQAEKALTASDAPLLVDIGIEKVKIKRSQVEGKVIATIKLP